MPSLLELQTGFRNALLLGGGAEDEVLPWLVEPAATARQRLAVYRHSIIGRLVDALETTYPVAGALVGRPFLREAARQYALSHAASSGDLNEYGETFAGFLAGYPHAASVPYLADVARLEWQVQSVANTPDAPAPQLAALAAMAPADWARVVFTLAPHARLDSPWPVGAIWRNHQPGRAHEDVALASPGRTVIHGRAGRVYVEDLTPGEAILFDTLAVGSTLGTALTRAADAAPDFTAGPALQHLSACGLLLSAGLSTEEAQ